MYLPSRAAYSTASAGLVVVLMALAGFAIWAQAATHTATQRARHDVLLSNAYYRARYAVLEELALQHEYWLQPGQKVRAAFWRAAGSVTGALETVRSEGGPAERLNIAPVLAQQRRYLDAFDAFVEASKRGNGRAARVIDDRRLEPLDAVMARELTADAARKSRQSVVELSGLQQAQDRIRLMTFGAFGIGLLLVALFVWMLRAYRKRIAHEVAALRESEKRYRATVGNLRHQALHDALTDLPNRTLLRDRLEQAILTGQRDNRPLALLLMDLNRFKDVNDTFGHHCGDALLQQLAAALRGALRESDTVARLGGDEFALILPATDAVGAKLAVTKITAALDEPFEVDSHIFDVGASIGVALYPEHGADATTLMRRADVAMYVAKRTGVDSVTYSPEQDQNDPDRLVLARELRCAIENDELRLHYQPQVNLRTGCAEHVEALVRWEHPTRGLMAPARFIPLAEETGLFKPLTRWVLEAALEQCAAWQKAGLDIRVAVNLSPRALHDPQLVETVAEALDRWRVRPSCLEVEITESAMIIDPDRALETLGRLHEMGIWISIDDFGSGYSSLPYLKRLEINAIKIDRCFVKDMTANPDNAFIVRSIIDLSHNLGLLVAAEGVENEATLELLELWGCDMAQGNEIRPPLPGDTFAAWLERRHDTAASA